MSELPRGLQKAGPLLSGVMENKPRIYTGKNRRLKFIFMSKLMFNYARILAFLQATV
jgi:hypothetical protein